MDKEQLWQGRALEFIQHTFAGAQGYTDETVMDHSLLALKRTAGADIVLMIVYDDAFTARVLHAHPYYLADMTLPRQRVTRAWKGGEVIYLEDLSRETEAFPELFAAMYSAVIIPLQRRQEVSYLVMGWSEQQRFAGSFATFAKVVQDRMRELVLTHAFRKVTKGNIGLMSAVFHGLPQAVIFIDDNGYTSWINYAAAALLRQAMYGEQSTSIISGAMQELRSKASNRADIEERARELIRDPKATIECWLWRYEDAEVPHKLLRVCTKLIESPQHNGRLWVMEDISDITTTT